jgi:hypothetical protein
VPPLHIEIFIFEKHLNLDIWWYFKVPFLANFGKFWQFCADFAEIMAESMPERGMKSSKPHNF